MGAGDQPDEAYDVALDWGARRMEKVDAAWAALRGAGVVGTAAPLAKGKAALDVLSRLNRTKGGGVVKNKNGEAIGKKVDDKEWRALLGGGAGTTTPTPKTTAEKSASIARARLAIEKAGGVVRVTQNTRTDGVVKVTEMRNFAGTQMEVTKTYETNSREAKAAAKRDAAEKQGGLDKVLLQMEKQKKLNVLDKSKMDWSEAKASDAGMEEDLEKHKKGKTYLEEVDFLKRAELREYEIERDARLAGDVRSRGRL
mmetsp:Transcript_6445/g.24299  ORF Transcript_6445/g.24299 Transcript_6445/m.24299 type:complete len:255 (-) Transcript_6445:133-897(-)